MSTVSFWKRAAAGAVLAGAAFAGLAGLVGLSACGTAGPGSMAGATGSGAAAQQFDVDAFLRASDTTLAEVLTNADFLTATRVPAADCAAMLQSERSGVLEDLPGAARGNAWLLRSPSRPTRAWLVASQAGGERTCHGPLPADAMHRLADRATD